MGVVASNVIGGEGVAAVSNGGFLVGAAPAYTVGGDGGTTVGAGLTPQVGRGGGYTVGSHGLGLRQRSGTFTLDAAYQIGNLHEMVA